jgi:hypothetical protein
MMLLTKVQEIKMLKKVKEKLDEGSFLEYIEKEKNKKIYYFNQIKESRKEIFFQTVHTFQVVDGVSLWEVNRKLKKLSKSGISKKVLESGTVKIPLSIKKSNILATPQEVARIEKTIDELEGFEELRLHYFYNYKPVYQEKKIFGEITRWIELKIS